MARKVRRREQLLADIDHAMRYYGFTGLERVAAEIDYNPKSLERVLYRYERGDLVRRLLPDRISEEEITLTADPDQRAKYRKAASRRRMREAA